MTKDSLIRRHRRALLPFKHGNGGRSRLQNTGARNKGLARLSDVFPKHNLAFVLITTTYGSNRGEFN